MTDQKSTPDVSRRRLLQRGGFLALGAGVALAGGGTLLSACGSADAESGGLARLQEAKTVRIGISNEHPYSYVNSSGEIEGVVFDILKAVLAPYDITSFTPVIGDFTSIIPGLQADRFDIASNGIYLLPERCSAVAFTNPIYRAGQAFIVPEGNPDGLHSLADLAANKDVIVGTFKGTNQVGELKSAKVPESRQLLFGKESELMAALASKRVGVGYAAAFEAGEMLRTSSGGFELAQPFTQLTTATGEPQYNFACIATRKGETDLIAAMNKSIATMRHDGSLAKILAKYDLPSDAVPPDDATVKALCAPTGG